jgi:hypothetical protein
MLSDPLQLKLAQTVFQRDTVRIPVETLIAVARVLSGFPQSFKTVRQTTAVFLPELDCLALNGSMTDES